MYKTDTPATDNVVHLKNHQASTSLAGQNPEPTTPDAEDNQPLPSVPETHPISAAFIGQVAYICSFMVDSISYFGPRLQNSPTSRTKLGKQHLAQLNGNFQAMQAAVDAMESWAHEAMPGHPKPLLAMQAAFVELMQKQMAEQAKAQFPEGVLPDEGEPEPPATA